MFKFIKIKLKTILIVATIISLITTTIVVGYLYKFNKASSTIIQDELSQNYDADEYNSVMQRYRSKVNHMDFDEMWHEVSDIRNKLRYINKNVYEGLRPYFARYSPITRLSETDARNIYHFFSKKVSNLFYPLFETFTMAANELIQISPVTKSPVYKYNYVAILEMELFVFLQTEFWVNKLLILCNEILEKAYFNNRESFVGWPERTPSKMGDLLLELVFWLDQNIRDWNTEDFLRFSQNNLIMQLKNFDSFVPYVRQFKTNYRKIIKKYRIVSFHFGHDKEIEKHSMLDRLQNENGFFVLFWWNPIPSYFELTIK